MREDNLTTVFSAAVADAYAGKIDVSDYKDIMVTVIGSGTCTATVRAQGSLETACPTFSTTSAVGSTWNYVGLWDIDLGTMVTGTTGSVLAADGTKTYIVNTDGLKWLNFYLDWTAGAVTVIVRPFTNA